MSRLGRIQPFLDAAAAVAVLATAAVVFAGYLRGPDPPPPPPPPIEDLTGEPIAIEARAITNRTGSGRVVLVEFGDYECPYCARHAKETFPRIMEDLVTPGILQYAFLHYPVEQIHPLAFRGSEAAECAARQGSFWEMHARLFGSGAALNDEGLLAHAEALGLDAAVFQRCLGGETSAKVRADMAEGDQLGVRGTPGLFVGVVEADGSVVLKTAIRGALPYEAIRDAVTAVVSEVTGDEKRVGSIVSNLGWS